MNNFIPSQLPQLDTGRMTAYRDNLAFYRGDQWQGSSRNRRLVFNYTRTSINKITSYLMQGLAFPCYPRTVNSQESQQSAVQTKDYRLSTANPEAGVKRAEQLLADVYQDNQLQQLDWESEIDTAVLGDGCYKVFWDAQEKRIRVSSPDVSGIYAWWAGDDMSKIYQVASRYRLTCDEIELLYHKKIEAKQAHITELWTDREFKLYLNDDLLKSQRNPYGFIPFVIFPNLREPKQFWGSSDIPELVEPQRELNRAITQLSRILEVSGNPIAVLENVTEASGIKVEPGAVWTLPEDAKAYLLDLLQGGGIRLHIDYIDVIYRTLHDLSETPRAAFGQVERELSGAAMAIEMGSLIQKVTRKRTIRTSAYHRRTELILKLAQKYLKQDFSHITFKVAWGPILPTDVQRLAQTEQLLVQSGIHSRRTAMDNLGLTSPDAEFARWLEERAAIGEQNLQQSEKL